VPDKDGEVNLYCEGMGEALSAKDQEKRLRADNWPLPKLEYAFDSVEYDSLDDRASVGRFTSYASYSLI